MGDDSSPTHPEVVREGVLSILKTPNVSGYVP